MLKLIGICILFTAVQAAKYPADFPKCHYGDTDCIKTAIEYIIPRAKTGIPALNLVALNPIKINQLDVVQDGGGPVTLKTILRNVEIFGVDTIRISKVVGFAKDIETSKFELQGEIPWMSVVGDYEMDGRILILPVTGNGKINMTTYDNKFSVKLQPKMVEKNGKKYLQIKKINHKSEPRDAKIHLTNLFGGDEQLGRTMNEFLNQNWRDIYGEMKGVIEGAMGKVLLGIINNIFAKIEYSELFIDE